MRKKFIWYLVILFVMSLLGLGEYLNQGHVHITWAILIGISVAHWTTWKLPG